MYAIVAVPPIDSLELTEFRKKYDPKAEVIEPHITLVFPFPESIAEDVLIAHIHDIVKDRHAFSIHLQNIQRADDGYLYLLLQEGSEKVVQLHDTLYSGPLQPYLRKDLPYTPHVTIGFFPDATTMLPEVSFNIESTIQSICLVKAENANTIVTIESFDL